MHLKPVKPEALVEHVRRELERAILMGEVKAGEKLPSERDLAKMLAVSRPVVHEAILALTHTGLLTLYPRVGVVVNDFREKGSLSLLEPLLAYTDQRVTPELLRDVIRIRGLFELDMVELAARNRSTAHLERLTELHREAQETSPHEAHRLASYDFRFHHGIALASCNLVFPMLLNSAKGLYHSLTEMFYSDPTVAKTVLGWHGTLLDALEEQAEQAAVATMLQILSHGEEWINRVAAGYRHEEASHG